MAKISKPDRHPEDVAREQAAIEEAKKTIGPFWREHWQDFVALVQTYSDHDAGEMLLSLRERFWGGAHKQGEPPSGAT